MPRPKAAITPIMIERVRALLYEKSKHLAGTDGGLTTPEIARQVGATPRRIAVLLEAMADEGQIDRASRIGNSQINRWKASEQR